MPLAVSLPYTLLQDVPDRLYWIEIRRLCQVYESLYPIGNLKALNHVINRPRTVSIIVILLKDSAAPESICFLNFGEVNGEDALCIVLLCKPVSF